MTESREVLIDAMLREWYPPAVDDMAAREDAMGRMALMDMSRLLDTLLAHPSAVLDLLENAPCPTCEGRGVVDGCWDDPCPRPPYGCGGSGRLGRDGVLRALGMEQVGVAVDFDEEGDDAFVVVKLDDAAATPYALSPVFARVAVPEPSEGPPKLPADHSLCDLPCDLPDEAHDG